MLDLWEELERDVEKLGIDQISAHIQDCKHQESEVSYLAYTPPVTHIKHGH